MKGAHLICSEKCAKKLSHDSNLQSCVALLVKLPHQHAKMNGSLYFLIHIYITRQNQ
jgi:hypothetical protein